MIPRLLSSALAGVLSAVSGSCLGAATPEETRAIAKEAYIYGFPAVEGYKTLYAQAVDTGGPTSTRRSHSPTR
jgi:hypothetical protein